MNEDQVVSSVLPHSPKNSSHIWIIAFLIMLLFIFGLAAAYFFGQSRIANITPPLSPIPVVTESATMTPSESEVATPTQEPTTQKGMVSGRLCYPSEMLPKGTIDAKNITSGEIITQDYPGSDAGGKSTYSFELKPGNYYLRYKISTDLIGYHTETCKTGNETSCKPENPRVLIAATIEEGKTVANYDLCDFYYNDSTKPSF